MQANGASGDNPLSAEKITQHYGFSKRKKRTENIRKRPTHFLQIASVFVSNLVLRCYKLCMLHMNDNETDLPVEIASYKTCDPASRTLRSHVTLPLVTNLRSKNSYFPNGAPYYVQELYRSSCIL